VSNIWHTRHTAVSTLGQEKKEEIENLSICLLRSSPSGFRVIKLSEGPSVPHSSVRFRNYSENENAFRQPFFDALLSVSSNGRSEGVILPQRRLRMTRLRGFDVGTGSVRPSLIHPPIRAKQRRILAKKESLFIVCLPFFGPSTVNCQPRPDCGNIRGTRVVLDWRAPVRRRGLGN